MAHILDPEGVMDALKDGTVNAVKDIFPITGKTNTLRIVDAYSDSDKHVDSIQSQRKARVTGRTWSTGIYGDFELVDNKSGKVIDRKKKVKLLSLPHITKRYSYIIDGNEYQVDKQWRLKSGVYTRQKANGELETQFNLTKGRGFRMLFDPKKKDFILNYGTTNVQLLPVLQALGVPDSEIQKSWGKDIYANGMSGKRKNQLQKLAKALNRRAEVKTDAEAAAVIREAYAETGLRPDTTKITLGKGFDKVGGDSLLSASKKLLRVNRGEEKIDNRDALQFKELWSIEDFIPERIKNSQRRITRKIKNNLDRKSEVRQMISSDTFNMPVKAFFTSGSLAQPSTQVNPLNMINSHLRTTILGPGGISTPNAVSFDAKLIDPSHLGFLDPVATPEGDRTGITLHLGLGVSKVGNEAAVRLYDMKKGKVVSLTPPEVANSVIAFPDQYSWKDGKPTPKSNMITVSTSGGDPKLASSKDVDYVLTSPKGLFSMTSNLIPFLASDQANRAEMANRHLEQAITLKNPEQPLVQVHTGDPKKNITWEQVVGKFSSHKSPVSGTVQSVDKDQIVIKDAAGKKHKVELYDNYPLNDKKAFVHSKPLVKKGDKVKKDQLIGDTSFTKDGTLAIGTNLRVAYLPFKGLVFEDGIVISESAADKLTSEHLYKERSYVEKGMLTDLKKFRTNYPGAITDDNAKKMDPDGVIKVGMRVNPGETLIAALKKREPSKEQLMLKGIHRSLTRPWKDVSVVWDKAVPGTVTDVVRAGREIKVYVKTEERADIGDKLSGRAGNKGVLCYDDQTEILTEKGWLSFKNLSEDKSLSVCTLNPNTNTIEYHVPVEHFDLPYEGKMHKYAGRRMDFVTTPNHRHYVRKRRGDYGIELSKDVFGKVRAYRRGGSEWVGEELAEFTFPGIPGSGLYEEDLKISGDAFIRFFGYWVTEGSLSGNKVFIAQRKSVNPKVYEKIASAMREIPVPGKNYEYADTVGFCDARVSSYLTQFGKSAEKYIPREIMNASKRQLQILFDACLDGDGGTYYREKDNHTRVELFTNSEKLANDYQELALKLGLSANIKPQRRMKTYTLADGSTKAHKTVEYVVRYTKKHEVWANSDKRYNNESWVDYSGRVYCVEVQNNLIYVRRNGIPLWSGNTAVLPDEEMPKDANGEAIQIIFNPSGVPGRINPGQVLETGLAEVAHRTGETYAVNNFEPDDQKKLIKVKGHYRNVRTKEGPKKVYIEAYEYERGYHEMVKEEMAKHGVSATTELFDPDTGKSLGQVMVGRQYTLKLMHQVDKKMSARAHGYGNDYDANMVPKGGGKSGAQKFGGLGMFALLAHGATANIRDGLSFKSDKQQDDVWTAVQAGEILPAPKPSFAYNKFLAYLNGLGVNVEKEGSELTLTPLTEGELDEITNGELTNASRVLRGKDLKPEAGGLFDEKITGGPGGDKWSHITLTDPLPNPMFAKAITSILGLKEKDYKAIVNGEKSLKDGEAVPTSEGGATGPTAIVEALKDVNVKEELAEAKDELKTARRSNLNKANKRVKYLSMLNKTGLSPTEAYVMGKLPVIPPVFRPITAMEGGDINIDGLNLLYKDVALLNDKLKEASKVLPESELVKTRADLYDAMVALMSTGTRSTQQELTQDGQVRPPGILEILSGAGSPKKGFFHQKVLDRKQDLSMRSVIVPDLDLHLDEVGVPRKGAMQIYRPFVVKELVNMGYTPLSAREEVEKNSALANKALDVVSSKRPLLFKRDPVLHKFGIMAFKPKLHKESSIHIHPLVVGGFNADFDGDGNYSRILAFVPTAQFSLEKAGPVGISSSLDFWLERRIDMAARFEEVVGFVDVDGFFACCDLEDFPHGELIATKGHIDFYEVPDEVYVVAMDETTGKTTLAEVSAWSKHRDLEVLVTKTASKKTILTDDDPRAIYGVDPQTLEWVRHRPFEALEKNIMVCSTDEALNPGTLDKVAVLDEEVPLNYEFGYFMGATIGDGWVNVANCICLAAVETKVADKWYEGACLMGGPTSMHTVISKNTPGSGKYAGSKGSARHTINAKQKYGPWLASQISKGAANKKLPEFALSACREFRLGLLAGLYDTDGSVTYSNAKSKSKAQFQMQYSTTSFRLARELVMLWRTFGVSASITSYLSSSHNREAWSVCVSTPELFDFGGLELHYSKKRDAMERFLSGDPPNKSGAYSRYRLVPVPTELAGAMARAVGHKEHKTPYAALSKAKKTNYVSKYTAEKVLDILDGTDFDHPLFDKWRALVQSNMHFDRIVSVEKTGIKEDGYDLTVPGFETFMAVDGTILSNTMALFVPVSNEAVEESYKLFPSKNLFNPSTGRVMYQPSLEGQMGLFLLTQFGKDVGKKFKSEADASKAASSGEISMTDVISVGGKKTTAGRIKFNNALPADIRSDKYLTDKSLVMNGKNLQKTMRDLALRNPKDFTATMDRLKDLGFGHSYNIGFSFKAKDFDALRDIRAKHLKIADAAVAKLPSSMSEKARNAKIVEVYSKATKDITAEAKKKLSKDGNALFAMYSAGVKPKWPQLQQLLIGPMLLQNAKNEIIPVPVKTSYPEGLDTAGYWVASSGARKGLIEKVQSVSVPGALSKQIMNTTLPYVVSAPDCGTSKGIALDVTDNDVVDRYLAKPIKIGNRNISAGTVVTPDLLADAKAAKVSKLVVRSPLKCTVPKGMCAKCYGATDTGRDLEVGTNIGAIAGQSIGERAVQVSLKQFHHGGVAGAQGKLMSSMDRLTQLLKLPAKLPDSAVISPTAATVTNITKSSAGGHDVTIGDSKLYVPAARTLLVKKGDSIKKGDQITDGLVNPRELLEHTNIDRVQRYISDEMHKVFASEGVKRRNVEVVTKALTNLGHVKSSGTVDGILKGDYIQLNHANSLNKGAKIPMKVEPVLRGIETLALDQTTDWLARLQYRKLKETFIRGASEGWKSDIHGLHPTPGIVYSAEFGKPKDKSKGPY